MQENIARMGDNLPPNDAELLKSSLTERHAKPLTHAQALIDAAARIPAEITDAETAGKVADYIKQVTGAQKNLEALRVAEKEPYLTLGRSVDGFFKPVTDALEASKAKANRPQVAYLKLEADKERRIREETARQEHEKAQAEALAAEALRRTNQAQEADDMQAKASISEMGATRLDKMAEAKPAELAHSRGETGARSALVTKWVGELTDVGTLDLEVLRRHINPDALQKAVNSFVAAGGRTLTGAHIYEKSDVVTR